MKTTLLFFAIPILCGAQNRHLFFFGPALGCQARVNACRAQLGDQKLPYQQWLQRVPPGSEAYQLITIAQAVDIVQFVKTAQIVDYQALNKAKSKNRKLLTALQTPNSQDSNLDVGKEFQEIMATASTIYRPNRYFYSINEFFRMFFWNIVVPILTLPLQLCISDPVIADICLLKVVAVLFLGFLLISPFFLAYHVIDTIFYWLTGGYLHDCYGQDLQCQFDTLVNEIIPMVLDITVDGSILIPETSKHSPH